MPKRISAAERKAVRIVLVTMDSHLSSATRRAGDRLRRETPGASLEIHAADEWGSDAAALDRCREAIAGGDIVVVTMLFMEDHYLPLIDALRARRDRCDALICAMCAGEVVRLTRMGRFVMDGSSGGPLALLKRLRGGKKKSGAAGADQMRMLRRIPQFLRFIPGTAQDVRAYFLTLQYWLAGSEENILNMARYLAGRYAGSAGGAERAATGEFARALPPLEYPEVGVYHPALRGRFADDAGALPAGGGAGTVGLLLLRSYLLSGNCGHYDGVIEALEARGLRVVPAFAAGLDARPAIERFFVKDGVAQIDALLSLTGFSLVGGPAYNDSKAAEETLAALDVPYLAAHPVEFQTLEEWESSERGLMPVEATMMVAIPELDGSSGPMVFGGRSANGARASDMAAHPERSTMLAARVAKLVALRRAERADRKVAVVLFNFPPNAGNTGTAAHLAVFDSLHRVLNAMKTAGYRVDVPADADALRQRIIAGNASRHGALANVHARVPVNDHVRRERHLREIEAQWGPAPGRHNSDGSSIHILGERFGNVFVGVQPAFGYEGDPMRLLFEKGFAPTHAFSAFYRYLREDFGAHAVLHFGTHGALEFMPGKQSGLSGACWPDRLIGDLPNVYLYASNNPSEGTIAKRRCGATLVSYLTPPIANAGLYRGLIELKASVDAWRSAVGEVPADADAAAARAVLASRIQAQAAALDLAQPAPAWEGGADAAIVKLAAQILELEYTLIPHGLHVVGGAIGPEQRVDFLAAIAEASHGTRLDRDALRSLVDGAPAERALEAAGVPADDKMRALFADLGDIDRALREEREIDAIIRALDGRFLRPAPGGDVVRNPAVLPTGRNLHGFDPFRIPSAFAVLDGARQAAKLIARHMADGNPFPESMAIVLWGTDNLKSEGGPIAQVLALIGARPRFDGYGRIAGATLIPLAELGRPRVDVMTTLSGIFRDLLPLQIKLLAEASFLAASAEEPLDQNFVRKHALRYREEHGCDLETAALRVYGNAEGTYGANVNHLIENGRWDEQDELAETFTRRKSFAYGRSGRAEPRPKLLASVLADVQLTYQNLESVELGVTTVDTYFDTLGGINSAVRRAKRGASTPVYIGDQTTGAGTVRTLSEQVALETRTRTLNPKWYEGMLAHGFEGVRQIEAHVTNTMGWSATTGAVQPWVYHQITQTFILDPQMRARLAELNPGASAKVANRLIEASERRYWQPDEQVLAALRAAGSELEDRLEGIYEGVAA
ncbi:MAG: magnesium chelatase subunit H [Gammaproteobacteria bacterium]|nr:magnesium chelatase subunit H [Gammaproteobacteria bacterium]